MFYVHLFFLFFSFFPIMGGNLYSTSLVASYFLLRDSNPYSELLTMIFATMNISMIIHQESPGDLKITAAACVYSHRPLLII